MEKRGKAFIYKIVSSREDFDEKDTYYGSTFTTLSGRMTKHRYQFTSDTKRATKTKQLFEKYGIDTCKIILLETLNDVNKQEREAREYEYIRNQLCCNERGKTGLTGLGFSTEEYLHQYYEKNKEVFTERGKKYREENHTIILERGKKYREENREKINERQNMKIKCPCGAEVCRTYLPRHQSRETHRKKMEKIN